MKTKRITFEIPEDWHNKIKSRVALQGRTITEWVFEAIVNSVRKEDQKEIDKENAKNKI